MKSLRCTSGLLVALGLFGCEDGRAVLNVTIYDLPAGTVTVSAAASLPPASLPPGTGQPFRASLSDPLDRFVLKLPPGATGALHLDVSALDRGSCPLAQGTGQTDIPGSGSYDLTVDLTPSDPTGCGVQIGVLGTNGDSVQGTLTPAGGPLPSCDVDCGSTQCPVRCFLQAARGQAVELTAAPGPGRIFAGWSDARTGADACTGTGACQVRIPINATDPMPRVHADLAPRRTCRPDGFCWLNPLPEGESLASLWGSSGRDVWAVGTTGTLLHYNGSYWVPYGFPVQMTGHLPKTLEGVWGSAQDDVWAVGAAGTMLHFDGTTWTCITGCQTVSGQTLFGVWGRGHDDVWAVGQAGGIVHLHRDGQTRAWTQRPVEGPPAGDLNAITGSAPSDPMAPPVIWVAGSGGTLLRGDGDTFVRVDSGTSADLYALRATGADLFAGGAGVLLHHAGDFTAASGPDRWSRIDTGGITVSALWGSAPDDLWVSGYTRDPQELDLIWRWHGGQFLPYQRPGSQLIAALWGSGPDDLWAAGDVGCLLHWDGTQWGPAFSGLTQALRAVWGSRSDDVWIAGDLPAPIQHWDGTSLAPVQTGGVPPMYGVWGSASNDVWFVGEGSVLHFDGTGWQSPTFDFNPGGLTAVWGSGRDDVWAVGASGTIVHFDGNRWACSRQCPGDPGPAPALTGVGGSGPADVWAVGLGGTALHYDGHAWSPAGTGAMGDLLTVWSAGPGSAWAAGTASNGPIVLRWQNGAWTNQTPALAVRPNTSAFLSVTGTGPQDVWVAGVGVADLWRFTGVSWEPHVTTVGWLRGVWAPAPRKAWIVGEFGAVLTNQN